MEAESASTKNSENTSKLKRKRHSTRSLSPPTTTSSVSALDQLDPPKKKEATENNHLEKQSECILYGKLWKSKSSHPKEEEIGTSSTSSELSGVCFECRGTKNNEIDEDHPILLCEGEGCTREYHLSCIVYPKPLKTVPNGSFYCIDCDPLGTSSCLLSYFDAIDDLRAEFATSKEFVDFLQCLHAQGLEAKKMLPTNHYQSSIDDLIQIVAPDAFEISSPQSDSPVLDKNEIPKSELARAIELNQAALKDPDFLNGNTYGSNTSGIFSSSSSSQPMHGKDESKLKSTTAAGQSKAEKQNVDTKTNGDFGPELIVGKTIRMYCPVDNQYHHGRIIDWRSARLVDDSGKPSSIEMYAGGNYEIAKSEFLIRFPAGINGRKVEVMKWIIIEEHSCAVSISMIMALRDKGRGISGWRPAQLILRTTIELIPVVDFIQKEGNFSLIIFFGDENHLYCDLNEDVVDMFSPKFEEYRSTKLNCSPFAKSSYLLRAVAFMDLAMDLVKIELEEQRRAYEWHRLMVENFAHPKCLSMKSEYGLPPLEINREVVKTEINTDEKKNTYSKLQKQDVSFDVSQIQPKLCPQFQVGLDRQWICDQIPEKSIYLDNIASFSCSVTKTPTEKIALLKKSKF